MQSVYFDVPRWSGIAAAVVATSAMLVTIAFALRTGDLTALATHCRQPITIAAV